MEEFFKRIHIEKDSSDHRSKLNHFSDGEGLESLVYYRIICKRIESFFMETFLGNGCLKMRIEEVRRLHCHNKRL